MGCSQSCQKRTRQHVILHGDGLRIARRGEPNIQCQSESAPTTRFQICREMRFLVQACRSVGHAPFFPRCALSHATFRATTLRLELPPACAVPPIDAARLACFLRTAFGMTRVPRPLGPSSLTWAGDKAGHQIGAGHRFGYAM